MYIRVDKKLSERKVTKVFVIINQFHSFYYENIQDRLLTNVIISITVANS